jgi:hypothetical protein
MTSASRSRPTGSACSAQLGDLRPTVLDAELEKNKDDLGACFTRAFLNSQRHSGWPSKTSPRRSKCSRSALFLYARLTIVRLPKPLTLEQVKSPDNLATSMD